MSRICRGKSALGERFGLAGRFAGLGGLAAGLAASPFVAAPAWWLGAACLVTVVAVRPRTFGAAAVALLACLAGAAALLGAAVGSARVAAIDAGAVDLAAGARVSVDGIVDAVPRRSGGEVRVRVESPDGRLLAVAPEPVGDLPVGGGIRVTGTIREPAEWERSYLRRLGIADVLAARSIESTARRRGGLTGLLDRIRTRAETALGRGTEPSAAALLRGFVLGQDDRIDASTVDEFKRSGLAHLLAVSGQNVVLLAILAGAALAALGVPLRARLGWILLAIAVYVPVAGGGPSIQRAGIMGSAGVVAALSDRPRSRWYALLLAAAGTLVLNPRASGDIGWQLSFAAVVGILAFAAPLSRALGGRRDGPRGALAEGAALSIAATVATAPLLAYHFETASVLALPANLLALPAVAPVMWLGMLAAALGQLTWLPVEPVTWLAGVLAGTIAQIARWFASPSWALVEAKLPSGAALIVLYVGLAVVGALAIRWAARRTGLGPGGLPGGEWRSRSAIALFAAVVLVAAVALELSGSDPPRPPADGLRVTVLDVGQGEAVLLQPGGADPILVDAGPPDAGVAERLLELGVARLAAIVATHESLDHLGGLEEVLERVAVARIVVARADRTTLGLAQAAGADPLRVAAGDRWRHGGLRLEVLWPPAERLRAARAIAAAADPNALAIVLLVRWGSFELLLTADAEAELAPVDPGPIDVLKVAHHGSEDAGLGALLARSDPQLAIISVGAGNRYGHPAPETLSELAEAGAPLLRTDHDGELTIDVDESGWAVR